MASMTTNAPLAKRQRATLKPATIEALEESRAEPIEIGTLVLPAGFESACGILTNIFQYLDVGSLCNVKLSSLIQQCRKAFKCDDFERVRDEALSVDFQGRRSINEMLHAHAAKRLSLLIERYLEEFPFEELDEIDEEDYNEQGIVRKLPTPFICACEHGRMDDVQLFANLHPFRVRHGETWNDMVNQEGADSRGVFGYTPLMIAAANEHFHIVQYLIEQGGADPNIACRSLKSNALHFAVNTRRSDDENTDLIQLLLNHMSIDSINQKAYMDMSEVMWEDESEDEDNDDGGETPLDYAYRAYKYNDSPIRQEIIALIRSKGGKANYHDENGRRVGDGNGDLNH